MSDVATIMVTLVSPDLRCCVVRVSKQERIYVLKQKRRAEIEVQRAARLNKITEEGQAAAAGAYCSVWAIINAHRQPH